MTYQLDDLLYLMSRLRHPDGGCPWDIQQDFQSITSSIIEECYELVDAVFSGQPLQIKEELGDVLFQIVFYSQLGSERQWFTFADVIQGISEKLISRHPHVFPDGNLHGAFSNDINVDEVKQQWEELKQKERAAKNQHGILDDIPKALPALSRAQKIQKRVAQVGFDWPDARSALVKIREEIDELEQALASGNMVDAKAEMGDVLFSCVNVARHLKIDAESALAESNRKFEQRFAAMEALLVANGLVVGQVSLDEMNHYWNVAKQQEQKS
jgi:ATP diphosphatase